MALYASKVFGRMSLFIATSAINGIFVYSSAITYFICWALYLPSSNVEYGQKYGNINIFINLAGSTGISGLFVRFLDTQSHGFFHTVFLLSLYISIAELCYYFIHRLALHDSYFYERFHSAEHSKTVPMPMDTLFMNPYDFAIIMTSLHLPMITLRPTYGEYFYILLFYLTAKHFSFTNLFYDHHLIHMHYPRNNFCLVFPVFDYMYDTQWYKPRTTEYDDDSEVEIDSIPLDDFLTENDDRGEIGLDDYTTLQRFIDSSVTQIFGYGSDCEDEDVDVQNYVEIEKPKSD